MTLHPARHAFATTVTLTNGVPIESVRKVPVHSKIQTTRIYATVFEKKWERIWKTESWVERKAKRFNIMINAGLKAVPVIVRMENFLEGENLDKDD